MSDQKTIEDMRAILFSTIDGVKSGALPLDKAKVISDLCQVMVNSAKVEVDFIKASNSVGSGFLEEKKVHPPGIVGITQHRLKG
ncbi:MAG: hypothetical protein ACOH2S_20240 [Janthinobacterium svalbardensis]